MGYLAPLAFSMYLYSIFHFAVLPLQYFFHIHSTRRLLSRRSIIVNYPISIRSITSSTLGTNRCSLQSQRAQGPGSPLGVGSLTPDLVKVLSYR
ncbi:hypothetical protein N7468_010731 [Penicillium chermesinum]|uniref:Uncharacterized protein n=1 Tax=Penicillium chermesinum TaxID=63820 RepID=A0A9W9N867_9EURO|nr:uncharacterized protein N7468_010731 [Penicillium chermesinum]KAJ5215052.1 hypothetical protein N7468_010731 [Penicillium chermesinum]